ncbi:Speckle-type POZ protein B [Aphelenchoides fujianensis]|nr:Speckle-type POZ protein B [Aphelenchoides fujianensis]
MAEPTTFRWPLLNFDKGYAEAAFGMAWESPDFEVDGIPKVKFFLKFYPKGSNANYKEQCALYLHVRCFGGHLSVRSNYEFWIENGKNMKLEMKRDQHKFLPTSNNSGRALMCSQTKLLEWAKAGPLVLFCKITPFDPVDAADWAEHAAPSGVCRKIAATFNSKKFADVEVRVQGRVFPVNKMIISVGSPVFARMFEHETKERETGVVEIEKEEADLIELLLRFLYSGRVEGLKGVAARLLPVADCYEVLDLVEMCLASLVKNVTVPTVVRDLKLAFAHDHQDAFKQKLCAFARENLEGVSQQPDWTLSFVRDNPEIVFEVTRASTY